MPRAHPGNRPDAAEIGSGGETRPQFSGPSLPPEAIAEHISVDSNYGEVGTCIREYRSGGARLNHNTGAGVN